MRVLGIDPGLTRCGIGIVDSTGSQNLSMVGVGVIKTDPDAALEFRLLELEKEISSWISKFKPDVIAVERVFSQLNVKTAMATGQAAGVGKIKFSGSSRTSTPGAFLNISLASFTSTLCVLRRGQHSA